MLRSLAVALLIVSGCRASGPVPVGQSNPRPLLNIDRREIPESEVPQEGEQMIARVANDGSRGGLVVLTRDNNRWQKSRTDVEVSFNEKQQIEGLIVMDASFKQLSAPFPFLIRKYENPMVARSFDEMILQLEKKLEESEKK